MEVSLNRAFHPCSPVQDVQRLKQASSKTNSKSSLSIVAAAIAQTPVYACKLDMFLSKMVAMETKGPLAQSYLLALEKMDESPSNLQEMLKIVDNLPDIVESLLPGACKHLLDTCLKQVKALCRMWCDCAEVSLDKNEIQKVLTQACSIFQTDTELNELLENCGSRLRQAGEAALVHALSHRAASVMSTAKGDIGDFLTAVQSWGQQLQNCRLDSKHANDEGLLGNSKKAIESICNTVASQLSATSAKLEDMELCLNTATKAADVVPAVGFKENLKVLQSCLKLWKAMKQATAMGESEGAKSEKEKVGDCVCLQRCSQELKKHTGDGKVSVPHLPALTKLVEQCDNQVKKETDRLQHQAIDGLTTCKASLEAVAGGSANGRSWMEEWHKEAQQDWQGLLAYAEKSILTMDAQMLNDLITNAQQAFACAIQCQCSRKIECVVVLYM
eukprot:1137680-Amphidinium_carterae.2